MKKSIIKTIALLLVVIVAFVSLSIWTSALDKNRISINTYNLPKKMINIDDYIADEGIFEWNIGDKKGDQKYIEIVLNGYIDDEAIGKKLFGENVPEDFSSVFYSGGDNIHHNFNKIINNIETKNFAYAVYSSRYGDNEEYPLKEGDVIKVVYTVDYEALNNAILAEWPECNCRISGPVEIERTFKVPNASKITEYNENYQTNLEYQNY